MRGGSYKVKQRFGVQYCGHLLSHLCQNKLNPYQQTGVSSCMREKRGIWNWEGLKSNLGAGKQLRSENYLFSSPTTCKCVGGGGGKGGHIFSETKTLSIGIRYGFEALRALIGGMDGVRICWWGTRNWGLWAGTRVSDDAQDVGLLPAMMFLIVWPLCARKIWDAI